MKGKRAIITRLLPKTGQTTVYQAGDDGAYQAGWWKGRTIALNKTRFVAKTIGGDDVVIDRATGLMWAADGNKAGCNNYGILAWEAAIIYAEALTFAGFSDWRVPNIIELITILNYTSYNPAINETLFPNTHASKFSTSTTYISTTANSWSVSFLNGYIYHYPKTDELRLRCIRGGI